MPRHWKEQLKDESGATLVLVGVSIVLFISVAALAIDIGMALDSRIETQRAADAAALAGASVFMPPMVHPMYQEDSARIRAFDYVQFNPVKGIPADTVAVHVRRDSMRVRAILRRPELPTPIARIFGVETLTVNATAVAEAAASGTAECLKPILVPDWWEDSNRNRKWDPGEFYDANVTGYGTAYRNPGMPGYDYVRHQLDYFHDWGRPDTLKMGNANQNMTPSWYFPFRFPGISGGNEYRMAMASSCAIARLSVGDWVTSEPGNMIGPTKQGIEDAIAADPNARWVEGLGIVGSQYGVGDLSPRIATFPLFNPNQTIPGGTSAPVQINNFGSFFIDRFENNNIIGRWIRVRAVPDDCAARNTCRTALQYLRLIG